ncbi:uncharacterized protein TNCV_1893701 [Trichonephila clavipes]|nr:uncharacterized protein TNCV_1893701 [Trichonephila clavipes]
MGVTGEGTSDDRRKRPRTAFTSAQIKALEAEFEKNKYLSVSKRLQLAKTLKLSETQGLGSNPGEYMDVCKCIVPLRHGCTLNSRRAANPLVRLVEERWEVSDPSQGVLPLNWGGTEPQILLSPAWCSKLRLTTGVT